MLAKPCMKDKKFQGARSHSSFLQIVFHFLQSNCLVSVIISRSVAEPNCLVLGELAIHSQHSSIDNCTHLTTMPRPRNFCLYGIPLVAASVFSIFYSFYAFDYHNDFCLEAQKAVTVPAISTSEVLSSPRQMAKSASFQGECRSLANGGPVSLVWAWNDPPLFHAMKTTIDGLTSGLSGIRVVIYCGSTACVSAAHKAVLELPPQATLMSSCISIQYIIAPQLAEDSPFEEWIGDHVLAKLLSAIYFEQTLQVVMQLTVIWKYGGMVLLPGFNVAFPSMLELTAKDGATLMTAADMGLVKPGVGGGLYAVAAPPKDAMIKSLMEEMLVMYKWPNYVASDWPVRSQWDILCARQSSCLAAQRPLQDIGIRTGNESTVEHHPKRHFGTLSYQARRHGTKAYPSMNQGDEMQGLAGLQFLPRLDAFVDRDRLDVVKLIDSADFSATGEVTPQSPSQPALTQTTLFLNAWWGIPNWVWPPPEKLEPIFVSMHLNNNKNKDDVKRSKGYLNQNWPIGARDSKTHDFFQSIGIHSVFTACMTMTLLPTWSEQRALMEQSDEVLLVDVNREGLQLLPDHIKSRAVTLSAKLKDPNVIDDMVARYVEAHAMKVRLQKAKLVITQRLHIALPAASTGTPVILIIDNDMPGGGGDRFSGLQQAVHTVHSTNGSTALALFNWDDPPPNPNPIFFRKKRNVLRVLTMCHGEVTDSARKFGAIPASWEYPSETKVCRNTIGNLHTEDAIHIATTINPLWLDSKHVLPSWVHALYKSNPTETFVFYFLTDRMNEKQRCIVRWMVLQWFPNAKVYTIPIQLPSVDISSIPIKHVPTFSQVRLLLPQMLPCVQRTLWIDVDAMVIKQLRPIWDTWKVMPECGIVARSLLAKTDVGSMMAALNVTSPQQLWKKASKDMPGFDAGVMLLDLDALRASHFTEKVASYWSFSIGGNDQISLNMQCNGTHGNLDSVWNVFMDSPDDYVHNRTREWSIVHFQGLNKPWLVKSDLFHGRVWAKYALSLVDALYGPIQLQ
jgi:lipopolysaccharide biosynthesis glycosyltransferase